MVINDLMTGREVSGVTTDQSLRGISDLAEAMRFTPEKTYILSALAFPAYYTNATRKPKTAYESTLTTSHISLEQTSTLNKYRTTSTTHQPLEYYPPSISNYSTPLPETQHQ
jgi:hypothetical protein